MRFKRKYKTEPEIGDEKIFIRFAWLPTTAYCKQEAHYDCTYTIWLENYESHCVYGYILSHGCNSTPKGWIEQFKRIDKKGCLK